jgi:hypothetical protein
VRETGSATTVRGIGRRAMWKGREPGLGARIKAVRSCEWRMESMSDSRKFSGSTRCKCSRGKGRSGSKRAHIVTARLPAAGGRVWGLGAAGMRGTVFLHQGKSRVKVK